MQQIVKPYVLEDVYDVVQECVLMDMFTTEEEVAGIVGFATHRYKRTSDTLQQNEQTHALSNDKANAMIDANAGAICILETIIIKYVQPSPTPDNRILISCQVCD